MSNTCTRFVMNGFGITPVTVVDPMTVVAPNGHHCGACDTHLPDVHTVADMNRHSRVCPWRTWTREEISARTASQTVVAAKTPSRHDEMKHRLQSDIDELRRQVEAKKVAKAAQTKRS